MSKKSINFTKRTLENLPLSTDKEIRYYDSKVPYLILAVGKQHKTFKLYKKIQGKVRTITLGKFPEYSITEMRDKAAATFTALLEGKELNKKTYTTHSFISDYLTFQRHRFEAGNLSKSGFDSIVRHLNGNKIHYPKLPDKPLTEFKRGDASKYLEKVQINHSATVRDKMLTTLKSMFNNALDKELVSINPFSNIKKIAEKQRERYLSKEEIKALIEASKVEDLMYQHLLLSLLITGQRKENVLNMKWEDIDLDRAVWLIQSDESKSKRNMETAITDEMLKILKLRSEMNLTNSKYVFPSPRKSNAAISEKTAKGSWWYRIRERAGLHYPDDKNKNVTVHDLRRTNATIQLQSGFDISTVSKTMNHSNISITAKVYAHVSLKQKRQAVQSVENQVLGTTSQAKPDISTMTTEQKDKLLQELLDDSA